MNLPHLSWNTLYTLRWRDAYICVRDQIILVQAMAGGNKPLPKPMLSQLVLYKKLQWHLNEKYQTSPRRKCMKNFVRASLLCNFSYKYFHFLVLKVHPAVTQCSVGILGSQYRITNPAEISWVKAGVYVRIYSATNSQQRVLILICIHFRLFCSPSPRESWVFGHGDAGYKNKLLRQFRIFPISDKNAKVSEPTQVPISHIDKNSKLTYDPRR